MFEVMGLFGTTKATATQAVQIIDSVGYGVVAATFIMTLASGGSLAPMGITTDICILTVKNYLARNLKAQAILY